MFIPCCVKCGSRDKNPSDALCDACKESAAWVMWLEERKKGSEPQSDTNEDCATCTVANLCPRVARLEVV